MTVPRLSRRLYLERAERVADGAGGFDITWVVVASVWGEITARTGRERRLLEAPVSSMSYRIVVRGAPQGSPLRPRPDQRFREGSRIFNIRAVTERGFDGRFLTCFADEEVAV